MQAINIEPRRAAWRMLTLGSTVWAPFGDHGWRAGGDRPRQESRRPHGGASGVRDGREGQACCRRTLLAQAGAQGQGQTEDADGQCIVECLRKYCAGPSGLNLLRARSPSSASVATSTSRFWRCTKRIQKSETEYLLLMDARTFRHQVGSYGRPPSRRHEGNTVFH